MTISHSQTTHRGNHREQNEDSCENKQTHNGHLFVTCDGMGGAAEGKKASSIGVKSILEFFERETYENLQIALYQSLKFANEQIYATAQINPDFKGMGTTACVVLFNKDGMYFAHVGDSRIYLQTDGKLKHLTRDHSFVNQLVDQGTLKPNEAKNHPEKNRILKALGVHIEVEPTVSSQPALLKKEDIVLLCSDGLTDMVTDPVIEAVLNEEKPITEKTEILLQKALDNGGRDNITLQLIEITESPHTKTVFIDKTQKNLADTLIGEEVAVNGKKYKFSKKHLVVLLPVLVLLGWFLVSVFERGNLENKKQNGAIKFTKDTIISWEPMPNYVRLAETTSKVDTTVESIAKIYELFRIDLDSLYKFNKVNDEEGLRLLDSIALTALSIDEKKPVPSKEDGENIMAGQNKGNSTPSLNQNGIDNSGGNPNKEQKNNPWEDGYFTIGTENKQNNVYSSVNSFINDKPNKPTKGPLLNSINIINIRDSRKKDSLGTKIELPIFFILGDNNPDKNTFVNATQFKNANPEYNLPSGSELDELVLKYNEKQAVSFKSGERVYLPRKSEK